MRKGDEFDIDAGLYLLFNAEQHGVKSSDAKHILREILSEYCKINPEAKLDDPKSNCERVSFPGGFHIDLPLYYFDDVTGVCRLATERDGWIDSDSKALQDWFDSKIHHLADIQRARLRRVIKNIKTWVALKKIGLPSIAITVYVARNYDDHGQDDDAFQHNAGKLATYLQNGGSILSPINGDDLIGGTLDDRRRLRDGSGDLLESFQFVSNSTSATEAHPHWSRVFEYIYPPIAEINEQASVLNFPTLTTPPAITVRIKDKNGHLIENSSANLIYAYLDEQLDFAITNAASYPYNSRVKWMVRNKDRDASIVNDLGHQRILQLSDICEESCAYRGSHYMECVIETNGVIRGACSVEVGIRGHARPQRNPPRRSYGPKR